MSVLEPAGVQADRVLALFDAYLVVAALVFVLVLGALALALTRKRTGEPRVETDDSSTKKRVVAAATTATVLTLIVLLVLAISTGRATASLSSNGALPIQIIGHRWWWEVQYPDPVASNIVKTSYEIHIPTGRAVELRLQSNDVIHSFWVPSLGPKRDLIPGKPSTLVLRADREGVFDGMCAEFCGMQHANMRLRVVAESPERFAAWLARARTPARTPTTDVQRRGQEVFVSQRCSACHAIVGAEAYGSVGPDLTHFASRSRLAMGTLANEDAELRRWINDPHADKPGVIMPPALLPDADIDALVAYLRSLE